MRTLQNKKPIIISPLMARANGEHAQAARLTVLKRLAGSISPARAKQWLQNVKRLRSEWTSRNVHS